MSPSTPSRSLQHSGDPESMGHTSKKNDEHPQHERSASGSKSENGIPQFETLLKHAVPFQLRRVMERLREGLFDPLGVKLISSGDTTLNRHYATQVTHLEENRPAHLCICGAYGQGKSHTLTYIRQRALDENFVVSYINLDPREVPFHNQKQVYRALMEGITFPDAAEDEGAAAFARLWRQQCTKEVDTATRRKKKQTKKSPGPADLERVETPPKKRGKSKKEKAAEAIGLAEKAILEIIPDGVPHRFKSILTAMGQQTETVPFDKRQLKKHARFKPREFPWILNNAFLGKDIPVVQLRNAIRYRQVSFYKNESLTCREDHLYMETIQKYGQLFQNMGYKGWVVLFDEAESIMLARIFQRSKSYALLHELFCPERTIPGLFPLFAFTHDFFTQLKNEDFERTRTIRPRKKRKQPTGEGENSDEGNAHEDSPTTIPENRPDASKRPTDKTNSPDAFRTPTAPPSKEDDPSDLPETREVPVFEQNYSAAWNEIHQYRLRDLTTREWHLLIQKLIRIHSLAYRWEPDVAAMDKMIFAKLLEYSNAESRMKLKLIVNLLDLEQQELILAGN